MTQMAIAYADMKLLKLHYIKRWFCRSSVLTMTVLLCALLLGCETKQNPIYKLLKFRTEIKEHCSDYSQVEWESALDRYSAICLEIDELELTKEERLEVDKIKGEIAGYAATVVAQEVSDEVHSIASEIESFAEGFSKTFQNPQ